MKHLKEYLSITMTVAMSVAAMPAEARVKLPQVLSSGMIVQREAPVRLWGTADPGEPVSVKVTDSRKKPVGSRKGVTTVAGDDGKWSLELPALKAGGPYTFTINDVTLDDVLSGDVFICSGQSNMELPVSRVTDMFADEIAAYSSNEVRQYYVPREVEFHKPLEDTKAAAWKPATQDNVMRFSALGYFFAKDLNARTGVPVGIISANWGGTPVESWISEESLQAFPRAINEKRIYEDDAYRESVKKVEGQNYAHWNAALYAGDPGLHGEKMWYAPDFDDSGWAVVDIVKGTMTDGTVTGDDLHNGWSGNKWASDGLNPINGSHWFRKNVTLTAEQAEKPAVLRLGCIIDADSVYVNGTFVGTTSYQYPPRIYNVPAGVLKEGTNNVTVRLFSQNGSGSFVPEKPYKLLLGNGEEVSLEGDWRYHLGAPMVHGPGMEFWCYKPTVLYNSMIHPLVNLPVAGVVWYQGESNVSRRNEYGALLTTMIADWRKAFADKTMPFYIVELADYLHPADKAGRAAWAEMRKVQAGVAESVPGAVLIHNSDLGEWNDIHPLDKKTLGGRVADAVTARNDKK